MEDTSGPSPETAVGREELRQRSNALKSAAPPELAKNETAGNGPLGTRRAPVPGPSMARFVALSTGRQASEETSRRQAGRQLAVHASR